MKKEMLLVATVILITLSLIGCASHQIFHFESGDLEVINRDIVSIDNSILALNRKIGDGMAVMKGINFDKGVVELELKGENNPGKSFVGLAFNIQNDSTYEAIYFRPFNFKANKLEQRAHSIQYISHPTNTWKFLRANHKGLYEAEYINAPLPDEWFGVSIKIDSNKVYVYDQETNTELLAIERLTKQVSGRIGLWTGFNSKGEFRNLKIKK